MTEASNPAGRPMVGKILNREEKDQMLVFHIDRCRKQQDQVTELKAVLEEPKQDLKEGQDLLKSYFDEAKADLGRDYSRQYLEGLIKDSRAKVRDLASIEVLRAHDKVVLGQPVYGQQPELFPGDETPAETKDELMWEQEGFALGRAGKLNTIPEGCPPRFHQAVMLAAEKGQELTRAQVQAGMEARQKLATPDAAAAPKDLNKHEPTEAEREAAIKASEDLARESLGLPKGGAKPKGPRLVAENGGRTVRKAADATPTAAA